MPNNSLLARRNKLVGEQAPLFYEQPLHIVKGEGVWLTDADGKRYLDVYNNVPNVGHCHPKVVGAMTEQAQTLNVHTRYLNEKLVDYGEKLISTFDDSLSMLFFTCSGTEANEIALRMARSFTNKQGIICTNATYHGNSTAVDELATLFHDGKSISENVKAVDFPCAYRPLNDISGEQLADVYLAQVQQSINDFEEQGIGFAGMLICPIFANEGLPNVPPSYMQKLATIVSDAGGLLIFDEVQSGFGRTGKLWGYQAVNVVPDIVTLGKPMGNGFPLAGTVCREDLAKDFRQKNMYFNTFGGNPVACAVGLAVLEVIEQENLLDNVVKVGAYLREKLDDLAARYELIGDVRNQGLFFGVELVTNKQTKQPAAEQTNQIVNLMKDQGVLISRIGVHENILKMRPPICFELQHADILLENLEIAFAKVTGA